MDWEALAAMVVPTVFILTTGAVIILRPITKRLTARLQLIEERQDFTERLLTGDKEKRPELPRSS